MVVPDARWNAAPRPKGIAPVMLFWPTEKVVHRSNPKVGAPVLFQTMRVFHAAGSVPLSELLERSIVVAVLSSRSCTGTEPVSVLARSDKV